ncbi:hypothetical protein NPIL_336431 [Nephila pilipes]|uniref:Uncharacterized protein n=1 Tax=Nephila pilipes TaxID=299642 RepID=A0A8X6P2G1_NEPPI|nr:hypothetical protein NPIL_336431 [Nephila pilipes]
MTFVFLCILSSYCILMYFSCLLCALTYAFAVCGWSLRSPWSLASLALWILQEAVFLFGLSKLRWNLSCAFPASACRRLEFAVSCLVPSCR